MTAVPAFAGTASLSQDLKIDLKKLDITLEKADDYVAAHTKKVDEISKKLSAPTLSLDEVYNTYAKLYETQLSYNFDMSKQAFDHSAALAVVMNDKEKISETNLRKAYLYCIAGMYLESEQAAAEVDTTVLSKARMLDYYIYKQRFLFDYRENTIVGDIPVNNEEISYYRNLIIDNAREGSYIRDLMMLRELLDKEQFAEADALSSEVIKKMDPSSHDFAEYTYYKATACEGLGNKDDALHWYIQSAIADILSSTKDNASLQTIAVELLDRQVEIENAFKYTQFSLNDAIFFNSKLRPWQIALTLPSIEKAYNSIKERHVRTNRAFTIVTVLLALMMLYFSIKTWMMYKKEKEVQKEMAEMNRRIQEAVQELSVANAAKEEYIGLFLTMCSNYIDKLKKFMSMSEIDAELKSFYKAFDNAFLQLYPDFVNNFNSLLKPEARIELKKDELLNTELRIFALIKLGITQSSHIAALLRYSVNTIYNYRAQVKNGAIEGKESFEEMIKHI